MDRIDAARAFNRLCLRDLGLMDRSYLGSGMGVAEVRVHCDLAHGPPKTARTLGAHLTMDERRLGRILRQFQARGWLKRDTLPHDRRRSVLRLTRAGLEVLAPLEARSRADIVAGFLRGHDPGCEAGWIAEQGGVRLGSSFCVRQSDQLARLRRFLLEPQMRGRGLGR